MAGFAMACNWRVMGHVLSDDPYGGTWDLFLLGMVDSCAEMREIILEEKRKRMNQNEYVQAALRTEPEDYAPMQLRAAGSIRLLHALIGMVTEVGEFADQLKRHIFYGTPIDVVNLREEVGDARWYQAVAADALGGDLEAIDILNILKLARRFPEKFTEMKALLRDLPAERAVLEGK